MAWRILGKSEMTPAVGLGDRLLIQVILGCEQEGHMLYTVVLGVAGVDGVLLRFGGWVPGSGPCEDLPIEPESGPLLPGGCVVSQKPFHPPAYLLPRGLDPALVPTDPTPLGAGEAQAPVGFLGDDPVISHRGLGVAPENQRDKHSAVPPINR